MGGQDLEREGLLVTRHAVHARDPGPGRPLLELAMSGGRAAHRLTTDRRADADSIALGHELEATLHLGSAGDPEPVGVLRRLADRKSTRLNSSHANISYAVFCL